MGVGDVTIVTQLQSNQSFQTMSLISTIPRQHAI